MCCFFIIRPMAEAVAAVFDDAMDGTSDKDAQKAAPGAEPGEDVGSSAGAASSAAPSGSLGAGWASVAQSGEAANATLLRQIHELRDEQHKQRLERKKVTLALRNAKRKRTRIRNKAKLLSTDDLALVMAMRTQEATEREARKEKAAKTGKEGDAA